MRAVVNPDRVAAILRPLRERTALGADPPGALEIKAVCSQNAPHGGRRDPHLADVAAAVRELAMRAVDLPPALKQLQDRGDLLGAQGVDRAARLAVPEAVGIAPPAPPPRPTLIQLEIDAGAAMLPAVGDSPINQAQQLMLGGRLDATRDPATQPQRSFPSASIKRTPISFNASDSRAISACAAASSGSTPPCRTPGRDAARASNAPVLGHHPELHDRRAIHTSALGRLNRGELASQQAQPDLILLRRRQKPLRSTASVAAYCTSRLGHRGPLPDRGRKPRRCGLIKTRICVIDSDANHREVGVPRHRAGGAAAPSV